ncbi:helicase-associated domain-containing protein [Psychromicrobium sp. YIM B11713]|uniref:helicase-associated domain-containing protein n=1 Tax=Psychromicrobium sp. YIM B11713 TaxID=3145233 RepID=UPI00374FB2F9
MSSIRALSQELASRSDAALRELFTARPDLVSPPVPDFAALAARACARISVQRALDALDKPHLQVLEAVLVEVDRSNTGQLSASQLAPLIAGLSKTGLEKILRKLNSLALLYRSGTGYLPVGSLYEVIGPHPAGLGRSYRELQRSTLDWMQHSVTRLGLGSEGSEPPNPAQTLAARFDQAGWWQELLGRAPEKTTELLSRFDDGPLGLMPRTSRVHRTEKTGQPPSALDFLLSEAVLVPLDAEHVELPREAGMAQRGGKLLADFAPKPEPALEIPVSTARRDNAALGSIAEVLREIGALQEAIDEQPLPTLRSGGVGTRALRPLAQGLEIEQGRLSLLLELSAAAGLIHLDADTSTWLAVSGSWELPREQQWLLLAQGWLQLERAPALVGAPLPGGQGTINLLAAEARRTDAPQLRLLLLRTLEALTPASQTGETAAIEPDSLFARARWERPRLWRRMHRLAGGMLAEAELLGLTGSGALTEFGRSFSLGQFDQAARGLAAQLPAAIDKVLLQGDLTAVAPGFLEPSLSTELALLAEREGQGPATTYRFSAQSVRRALDAGREPQSIVDFLAAHSSTAVPQPLEYLIRDTAVRHGTLRVEAVSSILRSSDEVLITALLHEPALAALGVRELAPGILSSQASTSELARAMRQLGYAPVLEGAGDVVRSTRPKATVALPPLEEPLEADHTVQLKALRSKPAGVPANSAVVPQLSIETLREAIRNRHSVRLTVVDSSGNPERLELVPQAVNNGRVRVFDPSRETERVISIHRIVDVDIIQENLTRELQ